MKVPYLSKVRGEHSNTMLVYQRGQGTGTGTAVEVVAVVAVAVLHTSPKKTSPTAL